MIYCAGVVGVGVNTVQNQLNHVFTQSSKLQVSGDWDQQAKWTNRGILHSVRDEKYGADACKLKEEDFVQEGQVAAAQVPAAKRIFTGEEPAPKKKRTASKPQAAKTVTIEDSDESDGDEEEEAEEEEEEEPRISHGKTAKKTTVDQGPRRAGPELHSSSQLVSPHQGNPQRQLKRVRSPWLSLWVLRCKLFRRKSSLFVCCDILCVRARARDCSSRPFCCHYVRHNSTCDAFSCVGLLLLARGLSQRWIRNKWFL